MSSTHPCPYCLEEIAQEAYACRHCGREVRLLLEARREIAELKKHLAAPGTQPNAAHAPQTSFVPGTLLVGVPVTTHTSSLSVDASKVPWMHQQFARIWDQAQARGLSARRLAVGLLLIFYLAPAPLTIFYPDSPVSQQVPLALAVVMGGVLACIAGSNLWMVAIYGFAQPFVPLLASLLFGLISLPDVVGLPLTESVKLGFAAALAGLLALLLYARGQITSALALEVPNQWFKRGQTGLGTVVNFIAAATALATVVAKLLT